MKYHDDLWNDLNNLLAHLRGFGAVNLVDDYYSRFGNPAPAELLRRDMKKLRAYLDSTNPYVQTCDCHEVHTGKDCFGHVL